MRIYAKDIEARRGSQSTTTETLERQNRETRELIRRLEHALETVQEMQDRLQAHLVEASSITGTRWMTAAQAADYLQVHDEHLRRLVRQGKVPAHQLAQSGHLRFDRVELDEVLRSNTAGGAS